MNNYKTGYTGTKSEQNLRSALQNEALGYTKYMLYADKAHKEGYHQVGRMFEDIANNEREHAELWLGYLNEMGTTEDNLDAAISGESYESTAFYPDAARIAREEGFMELADKFNRTAEVEEYHGNKFKNTLESMTDGSIYTGNPDTVWECTNCGYHTRGDAAPERCPLCSYPKGYFVKE